MAHTGITGQTLFPGMLEGWGEFVPASPAPALHPLPQFLLFLVRKSLFLGTLSGCERPQNPRMYVRSAKDSLTHNKNIGAHISPVELLPILGTPHMLHKVNVGHVFFVQKQTSER